MMIIFPVNIFEVTDNGMGLSSELQDTLFDTSKSMQGTNKEKGTGLGLIICKDLTEELNGTISVSGEEGKGSTFKISVPTIKKAATNSL